MCHPVEPLLSSDLESGPGVAVVPVPGAHAGLALHEVGDHLELLGVHVAVAVEVEHLGWGTNLYDFRSGRGRGGGPQKADAVLDVP